MWRPVWLEKLISIFIVSHLLCVAIIIIIRRNTLHALSSELVLFKRNDLFAHFIRLSHQCFGSSDAFR